MLSGIKSAAGQKDKPRGVTRGKHVRAAERERAMGDSAKHDATASGRSEERSGEGLFRETEPPARAEQRRRPPCPACWRSQQARRPVRAQRVAGRERGRRACERASASERGGLALLVVPAALNCVQRVAEVYPCPMFAPHAPRYTHRRPEHITRCH